MDQVLMQLLEKAKAVQLTPAQEEEQLVALAAANGNLSDERITVATVMAARTIIAAAGETNKAA